MLIKNLQSENSGLKRDLDDTSTQLDDARDETLALKEKYSTIMETDKTTRPQTADSIQRSSFADRIVAPTSRPPPSNTTTSHSPTPRTSTSSPALHTHYTTTPATERRFSTSISNDLLKQTRDIVRRLDSTDMRILNRRLQRTFDIRQLSQLSNTVLENILTDVDTMDARFFWLAPDESDDEGGEPGANPTASLVHLVQDLLRHIVQSSMTINQLQVAYVEKVEENEARVKLDFSKAQQAGDRAPLPTALPCSSPPHRRSAASSLLTNETHSPTSRSMHASGIKSRMCQPYHRPSYIPDDNYRSDSFWASFMMGDWRLLTLKTSSSSLDREWLLWD